MAHVGTTFGLVHAQKNATESDRRDFTKELSLFKALGKHEHLVTLYGCCTDQGGSNIITTMNLVSKVKFSGMYEYWTGTYSIDGVKDQNCFAKSLSEKATLQEASGFQRLATSIKDLKESTNVVRLICIAIEKSMFLCNISEIGDPFFLTYFGFKEFP